MNYMKAPFPWFGGKSRAADIIWDAFGDVPNYVEPFAGSLAVLLSRPGGAGKIETVNDIDAHLANVWRAIAMAPDEVAKWADSPVNEADLHARHLWLVNHREAITGRVMSDPDYFDAKAAGWWVWGACSWIGSGWVSGAGPWASDGERLVKRGNAGMGINRQLPHLGDGGRGINRQVAAIRAWVRELSARLRGVRVACGDWGRVVGPASTTSCQNRAAMLTGILLDPPYPEGFAPDATYSAQEGSTAKLWADVTAWAEENGNNPLMRIAVCGYSGTWDPPEGWRAVGWKAKGGYGSTDEARENSGRETIWLSPHCIGPAQSGLFG